MNYKSKIILSVMQEIGRPMEQSYLQKIMYLLCYKYLNNNIYYSFVRNADRAFSYELENEIKLLIKKGAITADDNKLSAKSEPRHAKKLDFYENIAIYDLKKFIDGKSEDEIFEVIKSEIPYSHNIADDMVFFTIGYEGKSIDAYVNELLANNVKLLCDVRKNAYSQKFGFSKAELKDALENSGITYLHMPALGIESSKREELNSVQDYSALFDEYDKTVLAGNASSIAELLKLLESNKRIAITCFEADVSCCHRGRVAALIGKLPDSQFPINHI